MKEEDEILLNRIKDIESNNINLSKLQTWSQMHKVIEVASKNTSFKRLTIAFKSDGIHGQVHIESVSQFEEFFPKLEHEVEWLFLLDIDIKWGLYDNQIYNRMSEVWL